MAKTKTRLSVLMLSLCVALALNPQFARADEYDDSYVDDGWYETDESWDEWSEDEWSDGEWEDDEWSDDEESNDFASNYYLEPGTLGVDVSEWNGEIDWERVHDSGVGFAILRCGGSYGWSQGLYVDEAFLHNARECERLGIPYGVYFYAGASSAWEAYEESWLVQSLLLDLNPSLPVYYDLEWSGLDSLDCVPIMEEVTEAFCGSMEYAGYDAGVYANLSWWEYYLTDSQFDQWSRWVAQYYDWCEYQGTYQLWQCTYDGWVDGIDGSVDLNYMIA